MCRWIAYHGSPLTMDTLVTKPNHSLVDQSINARYLALPGDPLADQFPHREFPTNGDGFGVAWLGENGRIGQFHEVTPAWDSDNLHSLAEHITTRALFAHVRAAPGTPAEHDNCHPFVHDGWMFQHNGVVRGFNRMKRALMMDIDPDLYPFVRGNTDSETCFYLALTYGLKDDPVEAMRRLNERIERARVEHGITAPFTAAISASDGSTLVTMRVSSNTNLAPSRRLPSPSLYEASGPAQIRLATGETERLPEDTVLVCSEPLELHFSDHTWVPVEDRTIGLFEGGKAPMHHPIDPS